MWVVWVGYFWVHSVASHSINSKKWNTTSTSTVWAALRERAHAGSSDLLPVGLVKMDFPQTVLHLGSAHYSKTPTVQKTAQRTDRLFPRKQKPISSKARCIQTVPGAPNTAGTACIFEASSCFERLPGARGHVWDYLWLGIMNPQNNDMVPLQLPKMLLSPLSVS